MRDFKQARRMINQMGDVDNIRLDLPEHLLEQRTHIGLIVGFLHASVRDFVLVNAKNRNTLIFVVSNQ